MEKKSELKIIFRNVQLSNNRTCNEICCKWEKKNAVNGEWVIIQNCMSCTFLLEHIIGEGITHYRVTLVVLILLLVCPKSYPCKIAFYTIIRARQVTGEAESHCLLSQRCITEEINKQTYEIFWICISINNHSI